MSGILSTEEKKKRRRRRRNRRRNQRRGSTQRAASQKVILKVWHCFITYIIFYMQDHKDNLLVVLQKRWKRRKERRKVKSKTLVFICSVLNWQDLSLFIQWHDCVLTGKNQRRRRRRRIRRSPVALAVNIQRKKKKKRMSMKSHGWRKLVLEKILLDLKLLSHTCPKMTNL